MGNNITRYNTYIKGIAHSEKFSHLLNLTCLTVIAFFLLLNTQKNVFPVQSSSKALKKANKCIKYKNIEYMLYCMSSEAIWELYVMNTQKCIIHLAENPLFIEHSAIAQI